MATDRLRLPLTKCCRIYSPAYFEAGSGGDILFVKISKWILCKTCTTCMTCTDSTGRGIRPVRYLLVFAARISSLKCVFDEQIIAMLAPR